jgi:hypothetical protein
MRIHRTVWEFACCNYLIFQVLEVPLIIGLFHDVKKRIRVSVLTFFDGMPNISNVLLTP